MNGRPSLSNLLVLRVHGQLEEYAPNSSTCTVRFRAYRPAIRSCGCSDASKIAAAIAHLAVRLNPQVGARIRAAWVSMPYGKAGLQATIRASTVIGPTINDHLRLSAAILLCIPML